MQNSCTYNSFNQYYHRVVLQLIAESERHTEKLRKILHSLPSSPSIKSNKFNWLASINFLLALFKLLKKHKFISVEWEEFKIHFVGEVPCEKKLNWNSYTNLLGYVFQRLRDGEFLPHKVRNPHKQICNHFLDQYGEEISPASMRTLLDKGIADSEQKFLIDEIVNAIIKSAI